uniref:Uncharacterized protein n=1 Tax=Ignisphaera aggregans TaxID=334771 RepID=A0A7J3QG08_9CREN
MLIYVDEVKSIDIENRIARTSQDLELGFRKLVLAKDTIETFLKEFSERVGRGYLPLYKILQLNL